MEKWSKFPLPQVPVRKFQAYGKTSIYHATAAFEDFPQRPEKDKLHHQALKKLAQKHNFPKPPFAKDQISSWKRLTIHAKYDSTEAS